MYDDSIATNNYSNVHQQHWYDEPPYESDPDDFLMTGMGGAAATIQVCKRNIPAQSLIILSSSGWSCTLHDKWPRSNFIALRRRHFHITTAAGATRSHHPTATESADSHRTQKVNQLTSSLIIQRAKSINFKSLKIARQTERELYGLAAQHHIATESGVGE